MSWKSILIKTTINERKNYCNEMFPDNKAQIIRCSRPHVFCKFQCDTLINKIEKILNYSCYQDCVKETKVNEIVAVAVPKEKAEVNYLAWNPKLNDKCDYKPSGIDIFVNCLIKGITEIDNKKFANIEYLTATGDKRNAYSEVPSPNLLECGKGLTVRTDCKTP